MSRGEHAEEPGDSSGLRLVAFARGRVGRVVELRVRGIANVSDIESMRAGVAAAVKHAGGRAVICGDYRRVAPLSRSVANVWARAMRGDNPAIARSALLLDPENAMFNLQLERIVRCAGNPTRRLFSDKGDLHHWLDGDLTPPEREAIHAFLSEGDE